MNSKVSPAQEIAEQDVRDYPVTCFCGAKASTRLGANGAVRYFTCTRNHRFYIAEHRWNPKIR